jgi:biopolymer transport protein ExbB/TolQ
VLGTVANVAPFIGLFGTVIGVIRAFQSIALKASAGPSVVASGIAEALISTAAGLFVAVPAVIAYNYFLKRSRKLSLELERISTLIIHRGGK